MIRRIIIALILCIAGVLAITSLQRKKARVEITPRPLLYIVADAEREAERLPLTLTRVSEEEENSVGRELAASEGYTAPSASDPQAPAISRYLNVVGMRVARNVHRKKIAYTFHYLPDENFVNAFAMPGGQIFVGRGLLKLLDTEDELAAILGHEVTHVDARHAIERLQYELASRKLGLGAAYQLGSFGVQLFQAGYTKEQELEADRLGLELSVAAGYSPAGAVDAMSRLGQLRQQTETQASSPVEEIAGVPIQALREYFRSHPPEPERIAAFERQIRSEGWNRNQLQQPLAIRELLHAK
jgi:predicted Zn-dependent protease